MRGIQTLIQIIAGLLLVLIPLILVYWVVNVIAVEPLMFISDFLGIFFALPTGIIRNIIGDHTVMAGEFEVDLIPIVLCALLLCSSILLTIAAKFIQSVRGSINYVQAKTDVHIAQKQKEAEEKEEQTKLLQNTVGYVVVRYKTQTTSSAYLVSSGLSEQDIKKMFMEYFNRYMYLDAQLFKDSTDNNLELVFEDVPSCLTFTLTLQENVKELNKQLDKAGTKLLVNCGIYCTNPHDSKIEALRVANKVCNLAGPGDVTCSREVKEIYEKDRSDHNLKFVSNGMYDLGQEIEIFAIKKLF